MVNKKYIWPLFIVMALAQIAVPLYSIWQSENIIKEGKIYLFKTLPIDPNDPFRGKYVALQFEVEQRRYALNSTKLIPRDQTLFATLENTPPNQVSINKVSEYPPDDGGDYIEVKCLYADEDSVSIKLPFDRFFMEENLAKPAEDILRRNANEVPKDINAQVSVKDGKSILNDILVNGTPIAEFIRSRQ